MRDIHEEMEFFLNGIAAASKLRIPRQVSSLVIIHSFQMDQRWHTKIIEFLQLPTYAKIKSLFCSKFYRHPFVGPPTPFREQSPVCNLYFRLPSGKYFISPSESPVYSKTCVKEFLKSEKMSSTYRACQSASKH